MGMRINKHKFYWIVAKQKRGTPVRVAPERCSVVGLIQNTQSCLLIDRENRTDETLDNYYDYAFTQSSFKADFGHLVSENTNSA